MLKIIILDVYKREFKEDNESTKIIKIRSVSRKI